MTIANRTRDVGGQAVIEGVMMRSGNSLVVAVRRPDQDIVVLKKRLVLLKDRFPPFKLPILRGIAVLIESLIWGMEALAYSANQALENEKDGPSEERKKNKRDSGKLTISMAFILSLALGIGLFVVLPERLASMISSKGIIFNITDGFIRLAIFLLYVFAISHSKDISRVFEYHGAEHKSIHAYESGDELNEENVQKYSTLHPRCGTAFLLTVMVIGIIVFAIFGKPESILVRIGIRLLFIPIIAGISYEIIKIVSKKQASPLVRFLMFPGLLLQKLTTKEPSLDQIQVAIRSLQEVLKMEEEQTKEAY